MHHVFLLILSSVNTQADFFLLCRVLQWRWEHRFFLHLLISFPSHTYPKVVWVGELDHMTLLWLCHLSVPPAAESRKGFLQQHIIASICVFIFSLMNTILIEVRWDPIFLFVFLKWLMILSTFHVFVSHLCFFLRKCLFWPACSSLNWFFRYCWIVEFSWAPCMICLRILCQRHGFQTLFDRVLFVWFCFCCFGGLLQKKNCMAMSWSVSPMFSSSSIGLLYMNIQYSQQHVLKRLSFLLGMFGNFVKVHLTDDAWVNFWQLYTVPLVYVFFFMQTSCCLGHGSSVVCLEV